jgi:hypothetical protein
MAAHVGTAIHNMLKRNDDGFCQHVVSSGAAPFWDSALGFTIPWEYDYFSIMGYADKNETALVRFQLQKLFEIVNPVMKRFAKLEDFYAFKNDFIKHGKPHWRKRADKFYKGDWVWDTNNPLTGGAPYTEEGIARYNAILAGVA